MSVAPSARRAAASAHLSVFIAAAAALVVAPGPLLLAVVAAPFGPAVVALVARRSGLFVRGHAREALRFSLSTSFVAMGLALGLVVTARVEVAAPVQPVLVFASLVVVLLWASLLVSATLRALRAQEWRYPFVIGRRGRR